MHDPSTLAFSVKIPLPWKVRGILRNDPPRWATYNLMDIWHEDPCKGPGGDDSCGWFMRHYHGDAKVMEKIVKRFADDWDRVFVSDDADGTGKRYYVGYFYPENEGAGMPNMGVTAIVLNLFFLAACEHFNTDGRQMWKQARRFMQRNLFDIMLFAENPSDSLRDEVVRRWGTETKRDERIRSMAGSIYGWILRQTRPWYKHPRWHIHHWRFQVHFTQQLKRWLFSRCCKCGKRFKWGYAVCTDSWNGAGPRWFRGEPNVYHANCSNIKDSGVADAKLPTNL